MGLGWNSPAGLFPLPPQVVVISVPWRAHIRAQPGAASLSRFVFCCQTPALVQGKFAGFCAPGVTRM